ncbi:MAG: transposase, partial [Bacilli bacterium]|nr:transposase [Bacilli bacterium]
KIRKTRLKGARQEGLEQGLKQGIKQGQKEMLLKLKDKLSIEDLAELTSMSVEEVKKILNKK